ncbi:MAG: hypothetical protein AAGE59_06510 [Cyanobacteria bacterium P01_F01_bin.86]
MPEVVAQGLDDTLRAALAAAATPPQQRAPEPVPRWTLKRLVEWVKVTFAIDCSRANAPPHPQTPRVFLEESPQTPEPSEPPETRCVSDDVARVAR